MTENEGLGQGSEKAFIVHKETKHCYHDVSAGRWHQPLGYDVMSRGGDGRKGYSEAFEEQLPLPTQAKGEFSQVVWEPVAFGLQEVLIVLRFKM